MNTKMYAAILILTATFLQGISYTASESSASGSIFSSEGRYVFDLYTSTRVGDEIPANPYSGWILKATLNADVVNLHRIRFIIQNDKSSNRKAFLWDGYEDPTSPSLDSQALNTPWEVQLAPSGAIERIYFSEDEPIWAANIKRGISASLQLQTIGKSLPGSFTATEPCLHGTCLVEYSSSDGKVIRKSHGIPATTPGPGRTVWASVLPDICNKDVQQTLIGDAERIYTLDSDGLSRLELYSVIQLHTKEHVMSAVTSLNLTRNQILPLPELLENIEFSNDSSIAYNPHSYKEPSNGKSPMQQSQLISDAMTYLITISQTPGEFSERVAEDILVKTQKPALVMKLHGVMSQLNFESLHKMFEDLNVGTSYDQETMRNIFLEVLPQARTADSAVFVRDLVLQQRVKDDYQTIQLVRKLPFSVAEYSEKLLTDMEPLMKLGRDFNQELRFAGILSFATLVFKSYINTACSIDTFESYVQIYFIRYTESPNYSDRLAWLQGLSNLQMGGVRAYLAPVISNITHDRHERFLAAWATLPLAPFNPIDTNSVYWPILLNPAEHLQMRVVALSMLLVSEPSARRVLSLQWHVQRARDPHLQHYWHTTLRTLRHTTYSCYKHLGRVASYVAKLTEKTIQSRYYASGNYLFDMATDVSDISAMMQAMTVANPVTDQVAVAYFTISQQAEGFIAKRISIYIKAEGVNVNILNRLYGKHASLRTEELAKLLRDMKMSTQSTDKVHVELIFKVQDKAMYVAHINQTTFDQWTDESITTTINSLLRTDSHINQQFVYYPVQIYNSLPTEFGTPLTRLHQESILLSVRGDLSHRTDERGNEITRHNHMQIGLLLHDSESLVTRNPLLSCSHEASTERSAVLYLPVDFNIAFSLPTPAYTLLRLWWGDHGHTVFGESQKSVVLLQHTSNLTDVYHGRQQIPATNKTLKPCTFVKHDYRTNYNVLQGVLEAVQQYWELYRVSAREDCLQVQAVPSSAFLQEHTLEVRSQGYKLTLMDNIVTRRADNNDTVNIQNVLLSVAPTETELELNLRYQHSTPEGATNYNLCIDSLERVQGDPEVQSSGQLDIVLGPAGEQNSCPSSGSLLRLSYAGNVSSESGDAVRHYRVELAGINMDVFKNENISARLEQLSSLTGARAAQHHIFKDFPQVRNLTFVAHIQINKDTTKVNISGADPVQFRTELFDAEFDSLTPLHALRAMRTQAQCVINPTSLVDLHGAIQPWSYNSSCSERLVLADCGPRPRFALLQHNLDDTLAIGVTLYVGGNTVKIIANNNETTIVEVNGNAVSYKDGYTYPEFEKFHDFKVSAMASDAGGVIVAASDVTLQWRASQAKISLPRIYVGQLCGACKQYDQSYCRNSTAAASCQKIQLDLKKAPGFIHRIIGELLQDFQLEL